MLRPVFMPLSELHIAATEETPEVYLNAEGNPSFIAGRSLPENAYEFYRPVLEWIREHAANAKNPMQLELRFDYFNSSSGRFLFEILSVLENSGNKGNYTIIWTIEPDDDLMLEKGEELKSLIELSFQIRQLE